MSEFPRAWEWKSSLWAGATRKHSQSLTSGTSTQSHGAENGLASWKEDVERGPIHRDTRDHVLPWSLRSVRQGVSQFASYLIGLLVEYVKRLNERTGTPEDLSRERTPADWRPRASLRRSQPKTGSGETPKHQPTPLISFSPHLAEVISACRQEHRICVPAVLTL